jgi:hypothetical protein
LLNVFVCANCHDPLHVVGAWRRWTLTDLPRTLRVTVRSGIFTLNFVMSKPADPELGNWIWVNASPY